MCPFSCAPKPVSGMATVRSKFCLSSTVGLPRKSRPDSVNDRYSCTSLTVFVGRMKIRTLFAYGIIKEQFYREAIKS